MHQLNLELLEQFNVFSKWLLQTDVMIPNRDKLNGLLRKVSVLAEELYIKHPTKVYMMKIPTDSYPDNVIRRKKTGWDSDGEKTEPKTVKLTY